METFADRQADQDGDSSGSEYARELVRFEELRQSIRKRAKELGR
jgi:NADH:ubiquinone oxidoreductase subunit D